MHKRVFCVLPGPTKMFTTHSHGYKLPENRKQSESLTSRRFHLS